MERIAGGDFGDFPSQSERGCKYTRTEGHHHSHGEPDGGGAAPRDHHASLAHIIGRPYGERNNEKGTDRFTLLPEVESSSLGISSRCSRQIA